MMSGGDPQRTPRSPRPFCWIWSPRTDSPWSAHMAVLPTRRPGLRRGAHEGDELGAGVAGGGGCPSFQSEGLGREQRSESVVFPAALDTARWVGISASPSSTRGRRFPGTSPSGPGAWGGAKETALHFFFFPLVSVLSRTLSGAVWVREVESPPLLYLLTDGGVRPAVKGGAWCLSHRRTGACGVHRVVVALLLCKKDVTLPERAVYLFIFSVKCRVVCGQAPAGPGPPRCQGSGQGPTLSLAGQDRDPHFQVGQGPVGPGGGGLWRAGPALRCL